MEQRTEKRLNHCLELSFGNNETAHFGWTRNLSRHGMLINSEDSLIQANNEIKVALKIGSDSITLKGVVCWNNEYRQALDFQENLMGMFIPEPPPIYSDYISRLL